MILNDGREMVLVLIWDDGEGGVGVDRSGQQPGLEPSLNDYPLYQIGLG